MPCTKAVWVQDKKYLIDYYLPWEKDVDTGWQTDWDETDYDDVSKGGPNAWPWIPTDRNANSEMWDAPEVGPAFKIRAADFEALAKLKCIEGREKGKIYATVRWGYTYWHDAFGPVNGGIISIE